MYTDTDARARACGLPRAPARLARRECPDLAAAAVREPMAGPPTEAGPGQHWSAEGVLDVPGDGATRILTPEEAATRGCWTRAVDGPLHRGPWRRLADAGAIAISLREGWEPVTNMDPDGATHGVGERSARPVAEWFVQATRDECCPFCGHTPVVETEDTGRCEHPACPGRRWARTPDACPACRSHRVWSIEPHEVWCAECSTPRARSATTDKESPR